MDYPSAHEDPTPAVLERVFPGHLLHSLEDKTERNTVKAELTTIVNSSVIGERLFASAYRGIVASDLGNLIEDETNKLMDAEWIQAIAYTTEKALELPNLHLLDTSRTVMVSYRGIEITLPIKCIQEEVQLRMNSRLRGALVVQELVRALPCETAVFSPTAGKAKATMDKRLGNTCRLARSWFASKIEERLI
eukprot:2227595-Amphidinium_carterae.1